MACFSPFMASFSVQKNKSVVLMKKKLNKIFLQCKCDVQIYLNKL